MAVKIADTFKPNNSTQPTGKGTFPVGKADDIWFNDDESLQEKLENGSLGGSNIQKEILPIAAESELGKIYQYVGENGTYKHGCFYECVETSTNRYAWKLINVISNPVRSINDDIYSHFNEYEEGAAIVYTGEDTSSYQKGHHYKKVIHGSVPTYSVRVHQDAEHQTATPYQSLEPMVEVGTVLFYTDYNSGFVPTCKCIAISGDEYTWYRYEDGLTITSLYGVYISSNSASNLLTYWEDIGGGGDGSSEFIGTKAEWDALSQSQKDKYDGKIVNITDDTNTNGKFVDITSQCTVVLGTAKVMKCGQIVTINGYAPKATGSNGFKTVVTGVPVPISNGTTNSAFGVMVTTGGSSGQGFAVKVNDSTLSAYCSISYTQEYSITYLTDE